jgi:hypothetical protein
MAILAILAIQLNKIKDLRGIAIILSILSGDTADTLSSLFTFMVIFFRLNLKMVSRLKLDRYTTDTIDTRPIHFQRKSPLPLNFCIKKSAFETEAPPHIYQAD